MTEGIPQIFEEAIRGLSIDVKKAVSRVMHGAGGKPQEVEQIRANVVKAVAMDKLGHYGFQQKPTLERTGRMPKKEMNPPMTSAQRIEVERRAKEAALAPKNDPRIP